MLQRYFIRCNYSGLLFGWLMFNTTGWADEPPAPVKEPPVAATKEPATEIVPATRTIRSQTAILAWIDQIELPARDAGTLAEFTIREGARVKAGELLGKLDQLEQLAERDKARLEIEVAKQKAGSRVQRDYAKVSHEIAKADLARAVESNKTFAKSVSVTELDQHRLAVDKTRFEMEKSDEDAKLAKLDEQLKEAELRVVETRLERRTLLAPFAGLVVQVHKHQGEWVQPGDKVLRLLRTDRLRIETFIPQAELTTDLLHSPVRYLYTLPGQEQQTVTGQVTFVSPEVNAVNGQVRVWAEIDNPNGILRAGQNGSLEIDVSTMPTKPATPPNKPE